MLRPLLRHSIQSEAIITVLLIILAPALFAQRGSNSAVTYAHWENSYEHAFSAEVPQGWTVRGGLFRLGFSDERPMLDIISPDGKINIRLGDVAIPSYSLPNQYHPREGENYDLGAQAQMTVALYRSGEEFAKLYAVQRFLRQCNALDPQSNDGAAPVHDYIPDQPGALASSSAGQVTYACDTGANRRIGYVYARTSAAPTLWQVTALVSFIAPADRVPLVRSIVQHATQSFQLNPQWIVYQKNMDAQGMAYQQLRQQQRRDQINAQIRQFESQMHAMQDQVNAFERRQDAQAAQVTSFTNTLTGIQPTTDPLGNEHDVWMGTKSNYWMDGNGRYLNSTDSPGPGWTLLKPHN